MTAVDVVLSHPLVLLGLSWLVARLHTVLAVRAKIRDLGQTYRFTRYLRRRWRQVLVSVLTSLLAYGFLVGMDIVPAPAAGVLAGAAADKVIGMLSNRYMQGARGDAPPGADENDITEIAQDVLSETTRIEPRRPRA